MKQLLCFAFMCALAFTVSCSRDYRTFKDTEGRFSVDYPRGWELKPGAQTGVIVTFESPAEGLADDFLENFSVTAGDIPPSMTEEDFAKASVEAPKAYIPKFRLISEEKLSKGKYPAYRVVYSGDLAGEELVWEQVFFVRKGLGCTVIFTISAKKVGAYRTLIDDVVQSLRIR